MTRSDGARVTPPRRSLALRLGLGIVLGASLILAAAGVWNIALQREHMMALLSQSASGTAGVILRSTRDAMLANNPAELNRMLANLGEQPGVERIRIFDHLGQVRRSTDPEDLAPVNAGVDQCSACHEAGRPPERLVGRARSRTFETDDGRRLLGIVTPIPNEPDCTSCHAHPADQELLGVLDIQLAVDPLEARLEASEWQLGLGLLFTVAAVLLLVGYLVKRRILDPVGELTMASARVASGDLSARVPVKSDDEIGQMTGAWNDMVQELGLARTELERLSRGLEQRVEQKTAELESAHRSMMMVEKMASLGKLSAIVAHELNNPLAGIAVYARLLAKRLAEAPDSAETLRILDLVGNEAVRCGNIVRNLLQFSRGSRVQMAQEDPAMLLERCVMLFQHQADLKSVAVGVDVDEGTPQVHCDSAQIQQLILGLAINAIEAMPDGGRLSLRARADGEDFVVEITDNGCGIPPEHVDRIFEPFWTTKSGAKASGLGLAVAYGIVQSHHGHIDVHSVPDVGTTFTVRLPLYRPEGPEVAADLLEEVAHEDR